MEVITLQCKTITPLLSRSIIPGQNQYHFELRPQSVKGVLRFWFRALAPMVIHVNNNDSEQKKYVDLLKLEEKIFGSTERRSPFSIFVDYERKIDNANNLVKDRNYKYSLQYSLYGTISPAADISYSYLKENSDLNFVLRFRGKSSSTLIDFIIELFKLVSNYGGFGAKSRKGYGSFLIRNIFKGQYINEKEEKFDLSKIGKKTFSSLEELKKLRNEHTTNEKQVKTDNVVENAKKALNKFIKESSLELKMQSDEVNDFSPQDFPTLAVSKEKLLVTNKKNWKDVFKKIFKPRHFDKVDGIYTKIKLKKLRGFKKEEINSKTDCLNALRFSIMKNKKIDSNALIKPSILGLPIVYQKVNQKPGKIGSEKIEINNLVKQSENSEFTKQRKGSPLFISIHKDGSFYFARALLMPSKISEKRTSDDKPILSICYKNIDDTALGNENFESLWQAFEEES